MSARPIIACRHCAGSGKVPLEDVLWATLGLLRAIGPGTAQDLQRSSEDSISVNGFNNRLERLRRLGMVRRKRDGKFWIYFLVWRKP